MFIGERESIVQMAFNETVTVAVNSQAVSLKDVKKVAILVGVEIAPTTPTSAVTLPLATVINPATVTVVVGDATENPSSFAALTGAKVVVGQSTIGQLTGWDAVQIAAAGTIATGRTLTIDGKVLTLAANSSVADSNLLSSAATAFTASLASAIARFCPHLETFDVATADSGARLVIRRKYPGDKIDVVVTANASASDGMSIMGIRQTGVINFTAADVVATNSSYTHFAVRINSTVTGGRRVNTMAILDGGHSELVSIKSTL